MKRRIWWLLVAVAALPGAVLLFLWVLGFDANPYAAGTPQWLWYIPFFTPLLMVGAIYGAGWLVARLPLGWDWVGACAGFPGSRRAGRAGGLWGGTKCDLLRAARGQPRPLGLPVRRLHRRRRECLSSWLAWLFCLLGTAMAWVVILPPWLVGVWAIYRQQRWAVAESSG